MNMVTYQRIGVIVVTILFNFSQVFKLQFLRLFVIRGGCKNISCVTEKLNTTGIVEDGDVLQFIYKCHLVSNLIALLPCICLASWSDRHGRKLLFILPLIGSFISDGFMLLTLLEPSVPILVLLASESVYGFCGGTVLIVMGCLAYITDATDHRLRSWVISLFWGLLNLTPLVDMCMQRFLTPTFLGHNFRLFALIGIPVKMVITSVLIIYVKSFVAESVFMLGSFQGNPWKNLVTPINVSDTVNCVFKRRMDNVRFYIISLFVVLIFYTTSIHGSYLAVPQYLQSVYRWSNKALLICISITVITQMVSLWLIVYSAYRLRCLDSSLGIAGSLSLSLSSLVLAFSNTSYIAITGVFCGTLSLLIPTCAISMLTKLVERVETGCMFAGIGFVMLISQLIAVPSYQLLIQACLEANTPQLVFLLPFGLAVFGFIFFAYLRKYIAPDLLGHLDRGECLTLINRRGQIENLF